MSFKFDEPTVATGEIDFASHGNIIAPKKPEKKAPVERAPKVEKTITVPPPKLIQGKYVDIGANLQAMLRDSVRGQALLDDLTEQAWQRLEKKHGVSRPPTCSRWLNSLWRDPAAAEGAAPEKRVTFADKFRETPEGSKMLAEYREHDDQVRRVSDMFIKAYLKSVECRDLYDQWLINKNRAIVNKEVYYVTVTFAKSLIAGFYTDCINYRCSEIVNATTKTFDVNVKTVEALSKAIAGGSRVDSTYPLKQYFAGKILSMVHEFPEKGAGSTDTANADSKADDYHVFECGIDSAEVQYMATIVGDIISRVNKAINDKNKVTNPDAVDVHFRTSQQFKRIVGCAAYDFCNKLISGICEYENNRCDSNRGFKVDMYDLTARLIGLSYDTTNRKNFAIEKRAIEAFIQNAEHDYIAIDQHKKEINLANMATKNGLTVDVLRAEKQKKETDSADKEERKLAAASGLTIEQYRAQRLANQIKRQQTSEKAKEKRIIETNEQIKKREAKLIANEAKWNERIVELKKLHNFVASEPPTKGLKVISAAADVPAQLRDGK